MQKMAHNVEITLENIRIGEKNNTNYTRMISIFYLDQEGPVAASVDMHFPTPGEHKGLEDH